MSAAKTPEPVEMPFGADVWAIAGDAKWRHGEYD